MADTDDRIASSLAEVRETVARIDATLPHLATKAEVMAIQAELVVLPHLATQADLAKLEVRLIKWLVATGVAIVVALGAQLWAALRLLHG